MMMTWPSGVTSTPKKRGVIVVVVVAVAVVIVIVVVAVVVVIVVVAVVHGAYLRYFVFVSFRSFFPFLR